MTDIWENIQTAITNVFRKKDLIEAVENREIRPYNIIEINLGTARTNAEFNFKGDTVSVVKIEGDATIRFNEKDCDAFDLLYIQRIEMPFYRFFITNTAQSGKSLILNVGREESVKVFAQPAYVPTGVLKTIVSIKDIVAGNTPTAYINMSDIDAKMIKIAGIFAEMINTGSTSSYISLMMRDASYGISFKRVYESGSGNTRIYWDGSILPDDGWISGGTRYSKFGVEFYNAGAGNVSGFYAFSFEKVG